MTRIPRFNIAKSLVAAACALSLTFVGCAQKSGKSNKTVVAPDDKTKNDVKNIVTKLDTLLNANKGKGKGVVTGFLTGENKSLAKSILGKMASNAGGERRLLVNEEKPLSKATILIFNSLKLSTAADTTLTTDSTGNYTCVLAEGKYFGFAVYLDLETFTLVTTSIPNMNPKADSITKMDTATAIEDVTAPTVLGVYDANSSNSDGIFLVGSVPDTKAKINITFSEAMNRDAAKGVILGKIDTGSTSTSMVLSDTTKDVSFSWSGDSKVLTLNIATLATGAQYGVILPTTLKDLAKNPLEKEFRATFVTVKAADLASVGFALSNTFPADKETIKPIQNPSVSFNRPVDAVTLLKGASIDPEITGYWEISGPRAVFIHKLPLAIGKTYTVKMPATITDLSGQALGAAGSFTFTVKDFEGAAKDNTGAGKDIALTVEGVFDAYLSGDLGRFAAAFHPNFRMYDEDGSIKSKAEFLDKIRADVGEHQALSAGIMGPVFDNSTASCKDHLGLWKVMPVGGGDEVWVSAYVQPGQSPKVYDKDHKEVAQADLTWDKTGPRFTYKTKVYGFGPDMSKFKGPVSMDAAKEDIHFMADMLKQTSTVALELVKLESKTEFKVDAAVTINTKGDTAKLAVKMIDYSKFSRTNFRDGESACNSTLADTSYQVLKFILINDGSKWMVASIISPARIKAEDFNKAIDVKDFAVKQIMPITLVAPLKNDAQAADGKVKFIFNSSKDSIGGFLLGLAEDPKFCFGRAPVGALIFVKASKTGSDTLMVNSAGGVESSNGSGILRRVVDLKLPGWDRVMFENSITTLFDATKGFGGVYNWKVIGIKDTSAAQFLGNGFSPDRFFAESDFGPNRGYFACKAFPTGDAAFNNLQTAQQNFVNTQPVMTNSFSDMDQDGVPDGLEAKYKTDPRDRNSYPDFRVDTDGDGLADFLEAMLDKTGADSLVTKKTDAAGVKAELTKLIAAGIVWQDSDGDGFPDDIEMVSGFNPMDPKNNPGTRARASAPIGVFAGKFQMGSTVNKISFRLYTDSAKALWVAYSAIIGSDTLVDTMKTAFNDLAGEVYVPVLLKVGPDAGRMMLMRGHYDANMSLIMGPIDMIVPPAKGTVNFGSGPYIGQFAASGRGDDVSNFLPNNNGGGTVGPITSNPVNPVNQGPMGYRLPPVGTDTGAMIIFNNPHDVKFVDAFGDTLAIILGAMFRGQPDGSMDFQGEVKTAGANGSWKRTEAGGHIWYDGQGTWVVDGHFFQESDSAGTHKSFPGQLCARAGKADFSGNVDGVKGTMKGWIAQDKSGSGFVANPVQPVCDPAKGPCNTQPVCDPAKGPCGTQPVCDPAKGPCVTNPVNSFGKTFMAGSASFLKAVENMGLESHEYIHVSMGGKVFRAKYDTTHIFNAAFPWCGQVVIKVEAIPAKDETAAAKAAYAADSAAVMQIPSTALVIAMEDQFTPGLPNRLEKARDAQGDVHVNVFVVEFRPTPPDYGKAGMTCAIGGVVVQPCDPAKQVCNNPVDTNKVCDPTKQTCAVPCDPAKQTCPVPVCDPAKGPCNNPPVTGFQPMLYMGTMDILKSALATSTNKGSLVKDSTMTVAAKIDLNAASMMVDSGSKSIVIKDAAGTGAYFVLSDRADHNKLLILDGAPAIFSRPAGTANPNPNPVDTTKPPVVSDTTKPSPYKGTLDNLKNLLAAKGNKVVVGTPQGPVPAMVNPASLKSDGVITTAVDANNAARIYVFIGDKSDPTKPAIAPDGSIIVAEKPATAGP